MKQINKPFCRLTVPLTFLLAICSTAFGQEQQPSDSQALSLEEPEEKEGPTQADQADQPEQAAGSTTQGAMTQKLDPSDGLIGSRVVGPGAGTIGIVEGLVVNQQTGEVDMYLVKTNGWFGSYGVIPLNFIETKTEVWDDGERYYLLGVRINEATFDNLAKWNGEGSVGAYLRRYQHLLSTVYGLEADALEAAFERYELVAKSSDTRAVAMDLQKSRK